MPLLSVLDLVEVEDSADPGSPGKMAFKWSSCSGIIAILTVINWFTAK